MKLPAIVSTIALLTVCSTGAGQIAGAERIRPELLDAIRADATGPHRIVVNLQPVESDAELLSLYASEAGLARVQADVERLQQRVFAERKRGTFRLLFRYTSLHGFSAEADREAIVDLVRIPEVRSVELMPVFRTQFDQSFPMTDVDDIHQTGRYGAGTTIAIVDDGFELTHPAIGGSATIPNAKVVAGFDFGDNDADPSNDCAAASHGTSVASVAAGQLGSTLWRGVAAQSQLVLLKLKTAATCTSTPSSIEGDFTAAMDWLLTHRTLYGIDIVSMSFGTTTTYSNVAACEQINFLTLGSTNAVKALHASGVILIGAAGNEADPNGLNYPACLPETISVGAVYDANLAGPAMYTNCTDNQIEFGAPTCYSNGGPLLDLYAPAHFAQTATTGGGSRWDFGGTSSAAPFAAGVAALYLAESTGTINTAQMRALLLATAGDNDIVSAAGVTSACIPSAPEDANCNFVDEDCDGTRDEDYVNTTTFCGIGACAAEGTRSCSNGSEQDSCVAGTPAPDDSSCNGIDDNCDGVVDNHDTDFDGTFDCVDSCTDVDSDGFGNPGFPANTCQDDCAPFDATIWQRPGGVPDLRLSRPPGSSTTLTWGAASGGTSLRYDLHLESNAGLIDCRDDLTDLTSTDDRPASPGELVQYLVRAENGCGTGSAGDDSDGVERNLPECLQPNIEIVNHDFELLYKAGSTTVTAPLFAAFQFAQGATPLGMVGSSAVTFSDGSSGNLFDMPGWQWNSPVGISNLNPLFNEARDMVLLINGAAFGGGTAGASVTQQLNESVEWNVVYTLTAEFGWRTDNSAATSPPILELRGGGTLLTPFESSSPALVQGQWVTYSRSYLVSVGGATGPLEIEIGLGPNTNGQQLNIDRVALQKAAPN